MKKFFLGLLIVVIGLGLVLGLAWVSSYGSLNSSNQAVLKAAADIDSTLQRRSDLIPNLVATVQGYATHEETVFKEVTEARAKVGQLNLKVSDVIGDPEKMKALQAAESSLQGALSRLLLVTENYPQLRAAEGFRDLQTQLEGTENRINVARGTYNKEVANHNVNVNGLFSGFVARQHGFHEATYFNADEAAKVAPKVNFGGGKP